MMPAHIAALLLPLLPVSSETADPVHPMLSIEYLPSSIVFHLEGPGTPFVGGVILSLDSSVCHYYTDLPPLLCNYAILGAGIGEERLKLTVQEHLLPPGIPIYAQGVTASEVGILATPIVDFVVDGSVPSSNDR